MLQRLTLSQARRGLKALGAIGSNPTTLSAAKGPLRSTETALGNLVTDALRWALTNLTSLPAADAAIINGGAIDDDLPAGDITATQLQKVLPYGSTLVVLNVTGAQIIAALENGVSVEIPSSTDGRFPQVSGLIYTYNASAPVGRRITSASTKSASGSVQPIYPCRRYVIIVNDYMAGGGDGYSVFATAARISSPSILATTAVAAYATAFSPLPSGTDGRITACSGAPGTNPKCPLVRVTMDRCIFPIGSNPTALSGAEASLRSTETALGNLLCDGLRWAVANLTGSLLPPTDACLINSGTIRAGLPAVNLSVTSHLQPIVPFGNSLVVLSITGEQLIAALENGVSGSFANSSALAGRFPQVSGVVFQYDSAAPVGSRIISAGIRSAAGAVAPVDPCKTYVVLVNDYMAGGSDGYTVFTSASKVVPTGIPMATALATFTLARSPLVSGVDGRITTCTSGTCTRSVNAACPSPPPAAPSPPPPATPNPPPPSPSAPLDPIPVKSPSPARSPAIVRSPASPRAVRSPSPPKPNPPPRPSPPPPKPSPPPPKSPSPPRTPRSPAVPRIPRSPPKETFRG
ncbi:hypothetical protein PLESTB_001718700 [Pleodorina starrii]|uniref:5'-Nucleotidase C-terminal domain-containing protein n=1 Tax=Pleodorina starrii TaxID=330485 RepID=A0A9W6F9B9_9CHLO|nr:hypothetical protein PLESTB_001718700 [Pleodorina starrii]